MLPCQQIPTNSGYAMCKCGNMFLSSLSLGAGIALCRAPDLCLKGCRFDWGLVGGAGEFSSPGSSFHAHLLWVFGYPLATPTVAVVAHKMSWSFCEMCRRQVTTKHTCILCMWHQIKWYSNLMHSGMVHRECVPRQQPQLCKTTSRAAYD